MASDRESKTEDGNEVVHQPVLLEESVAALDPRSGGTYGDFTLGAGGHAREILHRSAPDGLLLGLDRDKEILEIARGSLAAFKSRLIIKHGNFDKAADTYAEFAGKVDGILMDLGLSSLQLDSRARGFSIFRDGPLDFRMDPSQPFSARDLVNQGKEEELRYAIGVLGEEPRVKAIVKAILAERRKRPLLHTSDLRSLVEQALGRKGGRIHPATRTFQGLRMQVNRELESLADGLASAVRLLKSGGRLAVISFHSGEDRIVKNFFRDGVARHEMALLNRKPIRAGRMEVSRNRRSRSAGLRAVEKS